MPDIVLYVIYILGKLIAYTAWCYVSFLWFAPQRRRIFGNAFWFGSGRLGLGIFVGVVIFFLALSMNNATQNAPLTYLVIYVPIRIAEWSLWYFLLRTEKVSGWAIIWIAGGVLISCLADIPLGILNRGVVPVGRPLC